MTGSFFSDSDDNEDITVHRKPHRNAIRDSDSEEEGVAAENSVHMAEALVLSASSGEKMKTGVEERKEWVVQKSKRISLAPVEGEDSEPDQEEMRKKMTPLKDRKKRERSQRHREKKEKQSRAVEKLKKTERFSEINDVSEHMTFPSSFFFFNSKHNNSSVFL